jgi:hypothetical protein
MAFDQTWRDDVRAACDPVFEAADAGFEWNTGHWSEAHPAMLWEADPLRFAERYPDSGIEASYGDQWPAPCIDHWVYVDPSTTSARLSVEGFGVRDITVELTGDGVLDGNALAAAFAAILGVVQDAD